MMEALVSSETSVLTRATSSDFLEDGILQEISGDDISPIKPCY
jgi:hypothetical protein